MRSPRRLIAAAAALVGVLLLSGCVFTPFFSDIFYEGPVETPVEHTDPAEFGYTPTPTPSFS